jgi:hypothetical protein
VKQLEIMLKRIDIIRREGNSVGSMLTRVVIFGVSKEYTVATAYFRQGVFGSHTPSTTWYISAVHVQVVFCFSNFLKMYSYLRYHDVSYSRSIRMETQISFAHSNSLSKPPIVCLNYG